MIQTKDKARARTDRKLNKMEHEIGRVYASDPALLAIKKQFLAYMKDVEKKTRNSYMAYINEPDMERKAELKEVYKDEVYQLTTKSKEYRWLVKRLVHALAQTNQKALDIVNDSMTEIYMENYNQVAVDCRKVGIRVE